MTVVTFPGNQPDKAKDMMWVCQCGCSSFGLYADGRIVCCNCSVSSEDYNDGTDSAWRKALPPTPEDAPDLPEEGHRTVTRLASHNAARRKVLDRADGDDTVAVMAIYRDGRVSVWASETWYAEPTVAWMDDKLALARDMLVPQSDATMSALREVLSRIEPGKAHAVVVIDKNGGIDVWAAAVCETPEQRAWLKRHMGYIYSGLCGEAPEGFVKEPE